MIHSAIAATLLIFVASAAAAQDAGVSAFRAEMCERALQGVRDDQSAVERWRLIDSLSGCGAEGGSALAEELRRLRGIYELTTLERLFDRIVRIRDATVFGAALELADDKSATVEARIVAFRIFVQYENPIWVTTFDAFSLPWQEGWPLSRRGTYYVVDHPGQSEGAPLPDDWEATVRALLTRIREDNTEPDPVRSGAGQALHSFRVN